jgi:hypothetical protein
MHFKAKFAFGVAVGVSLIILVAIPRWDAGKHSVNAQQPTNTPTPTSTPSGKGCLQTVHTRSNNSAPVRPTPTNLGNSFKVQVRAHSSTGWTSFQDSSDSDVTNCGSYPNNRAYLFLHTSATYSRPEFDQMEYKVTLLNNGGTTCSPCDGINVTNRKNFASFFRVMISDSSAHCGQVAWNVDAFRTRRVYIPYSSGCQ